MDEVAVVERQISLTENAAKRIKKLRSMEGNDALMLRLSVGGGGCSGFSYSFALDQTLNEDDRTFDQYGVTVVIDDTSLDLLAGATIDFVEDLVGAAFSIKNPNATSTCGCGSSFSV
jgi:iron-sulfur cluster insertion protein